MNSYDLLDSYLDYISVSDEYDAMMIDGRSGTSKTFSVIKKFPNATIINGHITATKVFEVLKQNCRKGSIVIFDDCSNLLHNKITNALLKSAVCPTHEGKRIVVYDSKVIRNMEDKIINFEGKIIFILNEMVENDDAKAIVNKSFRYEFNPTDEEIIEQILKIKDKKLVDIEVIKFLSDNIKGSNMLNFRIYFKALDMKKHFPTNWRELVKPMIYSGSKQDIIDKLINSGKSVQEQVEDYIKATGKCRATYFNKKKKKSKSLKV
jgi:hypothetical protein